MVISTETKGTTHVARPGVVPGVKPGLKEWPFSPGFVLPVSKPGLKGVENREYSPFLY